MTRPGLVLALLALLVLPGCWNRQVWRQKLTVVVETPAGELRGSAVTEVRNKPPSRWFFRGIDRGTIRIRGEAVVVEIADGQYLFALLGGMHTKLYAQVRDLNDSIPEAFPKIKRQTDPLALDPEDYPLLVTFADITDPTTVQRVDPANLAASFGEGVRLKEITLQATREPVTIGPVEELLGWLEEIWPNRLDGNRYGTIKAENRFANSLGAGSFSTEINK